MKPFTLITSAHAAITKFIETNEPAALHAVQAELEQYISNMPEKEKKELTEEQRAARNAASVASKLKARAAAKGLTVEEYQAEMDKKREELAAKKAEKEATKKQKVVMTPAELAAFEAFKAAQGVKVDTPKDEPAAENPAVKELPEVSLEALAASAPAKGKGKSKKAEV